MTAADIEEHTENVLSYTLGLVDNDPRFAAAILSDAVACLVVAAGLDGGVVQSRLDDALQAAHEAARDLLN